MELTLALPMDLTPFESGYNSAECTPDVSSPTPDCLDDYFSLSLELDRLLEDSDAELNDHIFLDVPSQSLQTNKDATVLLNAEESATLRDLHRLAIVIVGPTGVAIAVKQYTSLSSGLALTFRPIIPGPHTVTVYHNAFHVIQGCPIQLLISRDYAAPQRRILSWDISPTPDASDLASRPWGLACNTKTEQLWVADRGNHRLMVYRADGTLDFVVGSRGSRPGEFYRPIALAYDAASDRMFVSDKDNHRVQVLDSRGSVVRVFGTKGERPGQFFYPWGLAVSPEGSLIAVADSRNHRVQFFDATGRYLRQFRVSDPRDWRDHKKKFNFPRGLAFNLKGDALYVTDFNLHTVFQLDVNSMSFFPLIRGGLLRPSGIVVDSAGNLIVADNKNHALKVFSPTGSFLNNIVAIPGGHQADSRIQYPTDVALLRAGFLAVLHDADQVVVF